MSVFKSGNKPGGLTAVMGEASIGEQIGFQVRERVSSRLQFTLFSPTVLLIAEQSSQEVTRQVDHQLFSTWSQYIGVKMEIENRIREDYDARTSQ
jgi:hypothetical protein